MNWDDTGFLISKNRYNENSLISEFYTKNHGKISGLVFGGTSKKIKNYLQIGNKVHLSYNTKTENKLGYFKIEIEEALTPYYFDNQQKLLCISAAMNLIKILTAETQQNTSIYHLIENFFEFLKKKEWIKDYIFWELELFKLVGYDLELEKIVEKKVVGQNFQYISKFTTEKRIIPNFLIEKTENSEDLKTLLLGLKLVGDYLDKTILKPNNLNQPLSRIQFINTLK